MAKLFKPQRKEFAKHPIRWMRAFFNQDAKIWDTLSFEFKNYQKFLAGRKFIEIAAELPTRNRQKYQVPSNIGVLLSEAAPIKLFYTDVFSYYRGDKLIPTKYIHEKKGTHYVVESFCNPDIIGIIYRRKAEGSKDVKAAIRFAKSHNLKVFVLIHSKHIKEVKI